MKTKTLNKRLVLKKETVAVLNPDEMNWICGGDPCPPEGETKTILYTGQTKASTFTCGTH
jgi:hypothetical protein